jgi:uncharacterized protein
MASATESAFEFPLGQFADLRIERFGSPGAFLALPTAVSAGPAGGAPERFEVGDPSGHPGAPADARVEVVLLPGPEIPEGATEGDTVRVFLYRDSEDRPIATTLVPKLALGEVAFLEVKDVTGIGAFFDWGLAKDLLVPFAEQTTRELKVGERHPIGLFVDSSDRLAGTMRVSEMLTQPERAAGDWVFGEAWRKESEIGLFVILERKHVALLPKEEPNRLVRGEHARFRIARVHADGKCVVSLRGLAHDERGSDADRIVQFLKERPTEPVSEADTPEAIQKRFGLSKKAFKRAVGLLLRERRIELTDDTLHLVP